MRTSSLLKVTAGDLSFLWIFALLLLIPFQPSRAQEVTIEEVAAQCEGVPYDQRIRISVARFSVSTRSAQREFGDELATILSNALQGVNCFRVLESVSNLQDMTSEIALGQEGFTAAGSSPQSGKMLGPQLVVTGEVTEYAEGDNSVNVLGIGGRSSKAHIGFILKVLNPETREIVFSKSIDVEGKSNGFSGATILGVRMTGTQRGNIALSDAIEKGVIIAVQVLATNKDGFGVTPNSGVAATKVWNASNCPVVRGGNAPKVMVIIPEYHITRQVPDPAGETEIIRKFVNAGFPVVDPS
ncbi:MAG: CsgG/HfaB family protein, partial [Cyclobacteriaceae bacterium]